MLYYAIHYTLYYTLCYTSSYNTIIILVSMCSFSWTSLWVLAAMSRIIVPLSPQQVSALHLSQDLPHYHIPPSDFGATVVSVARVGLPSVDTLSRNKRSLAVNLKDKRGIGIVTRLATKVCACVCVYVCVCLSVCLCVCMYKCVHVQMCACLYEYVHVNVRLGASSAVCSLLHTLLQFLQNSFNFIFGFNVLVLGA